MSQLSATIKSAALHLNNNNVRLILFLATVGLFILGAAAPESVGTFIR
jgi:hypothetical protein